MNQRILFPLLFFLFLNASTWAQIIVVEANNLTDTVRGIHGNFNLNFNVNANTATTLSGGTGSEFHYRWKKNRLLSINDYSVILDVAKTRDAAVNQGYQHLRYTYDFNYFLTGATFAQIQANPVLRIDRRLLAGGGPRFNIQPYGRNQLLVGTMLMYEYEEELDTSAIHNDVRASIFIYYKLFIGENLKINSVTYYQPRVDLLRDFRVSNSLNIIVGLTNRIRWILNFNLLYDAFPVIDPSIPNLTYSIRNGLNIKF